MAGKLPKGRKPQIPAVDAMRILRAGLDDKREATEFDWNEIESLLSDCSQDPPEGAVTAQEVCLHFSMGWNTAKSKLEKMVRDGVMESGRFRNRKTQHISQYYWKKK